MSAHRPSILRLPLKAIAALLSYPDQPLLENLGEVKQVLMPLPELDDGDRAALEDFIAGIRNQAPLDVQAAYVETFDRSKKVSLHLFEHVYGESRDRGPAMVELTHAYQERGLELDCRELPDYLPVFLEFCAELGEAEARSWLDEVGHVLQQIHVRLKERESPYAATFVVLLRLARLDPEPEALARAAAAEERDDTPEALDRVWMEAPVTFGPDQPGTGCGVTPKPHSQTVQWTDFRNTADRTGNH